MLKLKLFENLSSTWIGILLEAVTTIAIVRYTRYQVEYKRQVIQQRKKNGSVNIGAIFGMDIGGTLTKIVYFEANMEEQHSGERLPKKDKQLMSEQINSPGLRKNRSFVNIEEPEQKAALREIYEYMSTNIQPDRELAVKDDSLTFHSHVLGGKIHFLHFETRNMMEAINFLSSTAITENIRTIGCTGGGGHKYAKQFAEQLQIKVLPYDELGCLVKGMDFCLTNFANECYTFRRIPMRTNGFMTDTASWNSSNINDWQKDNKESMRIVNLPREWVISSNIFPYLVVNIGSGVSILKITSPGSFERVSGSSVGGGTYWGLCRLLTSCSSFEKVLDLAETGNAGQVDMLVGDIYGGSYDQMNLNASMVASSFGKLVMKNNPRENIKEEDLAIALLMMITNNIGQVSYLNAQLHKCSKIFFLGNFLRHNSISCRRLAFAIDFWSEGKMEALFLKHEGYFGALGTFLQSAFEKDLDNILYMGHDSNETPTFPNETVETGFGNRQNQTNSLKRFRSLSSDDGHTKIMVPATSDYEPGLL